MRDVEARHIADPECGRHENDAPTGSHRGYALILGGIAFAFLLRVLGQALVAAGHAGSLPPMEDWYSGLVPYPALLPIQIGILGVQATISRDIWRGSGTFAGFRPGVGRGLQWFSYVYAAVMVLRYVVTMAAYPERRWLSGTIPIFFHWVLAAYLFALGRYYRLRRESATA
jgi:hypothetical protein